MGNIRSQQPVRERDHNASVRAEQAYRLWVRGWTFERIAQAIGVETRAAAYKAWKRGRRAVIDTVDLDMERTRERERLEIAYAGIAERVEHGDLWSIDRAMTIAARKAALLGLDAKTDVTMTPPIIEISSTVNNALRGQPLVEVAGGDSDSAE